MNITVELSKDANILFEDKRPVVALNLAGLAYLSKNWQQQGQCLYWVDGVMGSFVCLLSGLFVKKKPGRVLLTELLTLCRCENQRPVFFLGYKYDAVVCERILGRKIHCIELPNLSEHEAMFDFRLPEFSADAVVFTAISSPKQELIALRLFREKDLKVFCIGGAVNMVEGRESITPAIISNMGLEWLFRLRTNTKFRMYRLLNTFPRAMLNLCGVNVKSLDN